MDNQGNSDSPRSGESTPHEEAPSDRARASNTRPSIFNKSNRQIFDVLNGIESEPVRHQDGEGENNQVAAADLEENHNPRNSATTPTSADDRNHGLFTFDDRKEAASSSASSLSHQPLEESSNIKLKPILMYDDSLEIKYLPANPDIVCMGTRAGNVNDDSAQSEDFSPNSDLAIAERDEAMQTDGDDEEEEENSENPLCMSDRSKLDRFRFVDHGSSVFSADGTISAGGTGLLRNLPVFSMNTHSTTSLAYQKNFDHEINRNPILRMRREEEIGNKFEAICLKYFADAGSKYASDVHFMNSQNRAKLGGRVLFEEEDPKLDESCQTEVVETVNQSTQCKKAQSVNMSTQTDDNTEEMNEQYMKGVKWGIEASIASIAKKNAAGSSLQLTEAVSSISSSSGANAPAAVSNDSARDQEASRPSTSVAAAPPSTNQRTVDEARNAGVPQLRDVKPIIGQVEDDDLFIIKHIDRPPVQREFMSAEAHARDMDRLAELVMNLSRAQNTGPRQLTLSDLATIQTWNSQPFGTSMGMFPPEQAQFQRPSFGGFYGYPSFPFPFANQPFPPTNPIQSPTVVEMATPAPPAEPLFRRSGDELIRERSQEMAGDNSGPSGNSLVTEAGDRLMRRENQEGNNQNLSVVDVATPVRPAFAGRRGGADGTMRTNDQAAAGDDSNPIRSISLAEGDGDVRVGRLEVRQVEQEVEMDEQAASNDPEESSNRFTATNGIEILIRKETIENLVRRKESKKPTRKERSPNTRQRGRPRTVDRVGENETVNRYSLRNSSAAARKSAQLSVSAVLPNFSITDSGESGNSSSRKKAVKESGKGNGTPDNSRVHVEASRSRKRRVSETESADESSVSKVKRPAKKRGQNVKNSEKNKQQVTENTEAPATAKDPVAKNKKGSKDAGTDETRSHSRSTRSSKLNRKNPNPERDPDAGE